jgi:hypothetical protein
MYTAVASFFSKISSLISLAAKGEQRGEASSAEFEAAVNAALLAATASENTARAAITKATEKVPPIVYSRHYFLLAFLAQV